MVWQPDAEFELAAQRILSRAREDALLRERDDVQRAVEQLAARGLRGGPVLRAKTDAAKAALQEFGQRARRELLEFVASVYGAVRPEAAEWIRRTVSDQIDGFTRGTVASLEEQYSRENIPTRGISEDVGRVAISLSRDLAIELAPIELRARLKAVASGDLPSAAAGSRDIDAFISYASEDRGAVAAPIADGLTTAGFSVWFDQYELKIGMSVYAAIDDGLRKCRFGVVILSPAFFAKDWPQRELHALAALAAAEGRNKILPIWHAVGAGDVARYSPLLADVYATKVADGIDAVVKQIADVLRGG